MDESTRLREIIMEIVDNQISANDPPITRQTYHRLLSAGYSKMEAKRKIAVVVAESIWEIMTDKAFDEEKYARDLDAIR